MGNDARTKALDKSLADIKKRFGDGAIMTFTEKPEPIPRFSTGSILFDKAIGGGWPYGRIIELYGAESSGKSSMCLHAVAEIQKVGGVAAFVDVEHAFDPIYAARVGVNLDDSFYMSQPNNAEEALEITEALVRSGAVNLIIVDSVAALVPLAEIEGDMGASHMGLQARLMSQALRKLTGAIKQSNCTVIFTNQTRQKIGVVFGSNETTTGGMALKFYASIRVRVSGSSGEKDKSGETVSKKTYIEVKKNKTYPPFKKAELSLGFGGERNVWGIDIQKEAVDLIKGEKSHYIFPDGMDIFGMPKALAYLSEHPELVDVIRKNAMSQDDSALGIINSLDDDIADDE